MGVQMSKGDLSKTYNDGDIIIKQGDSGDCMFVIQSGKVDVIKQSKGKEILLATRKEGDFFGEMSLFSREVRSATIRAKGTVVALTVDKRNLLGRIQKDPSLAFRIIETLSRRIRELSEEYANEKSDN